MRGNALGISKTHLEGLRGLILGIETVPGTMPEASRAHPGSPAGAPNPPGQAEVPLVRAGPR